MILFGGLGGGVMRVCAAGGTCSAVTALDPARQERGHLFPKLLPDGRHFLYFRYSAMPGSNGIYVGTIDAKPSEQSTKSLLANEAFPEYYVPSMDLNTVDSNHGHLLFYREGTVLAQAFNPTKLELSGDAVPVAEQVGNFQNFIGFFSASSNGVLVTVSGDSAGNSRLTWFDREGKNLGTVGEPGIYREADLSPDGKLAVVSRVDPQVQGRTNLWLLDLTRGGIATRFTSDVSGDYYPIFSSDSGSIAFVSTRDGHANLYRKLTNGIKDEELLLKSDETRFPSSFSERYLLYTVSTPKAKRDIWILTMDESHKAIPFQATEFDESGAKLSPDGRWIAYQSDESGGPEVYVREFVMGPDGKPERTESHPISIGGGRSPYWRDDGKAVIYGSPDSRTGMSAEILSFRPFRVAVPKALGQMPASASALTISGDGKLILATVPIGQVGPQQFTVVQNWQAGLKK
jgi:hypothetical protein